MEADQGRRLAGIEVAADGVADLLVELLEGVGLGVDRGSSCTGPQGPILCLLDHEKDFLHGALQLDYSDRAVRDAALSWQRDWGGKATPGAGLAVTITRPRQKGSEQEHQPEGPPKPNLAQTPCSRQACSRDWLDWHDCRQHAFQGLLGQLQIMAPLHPQPEALAQAEETAQAQIGVGSDRPPPFDDTPAGRRHARQWGRAKAITR